MLAQNTALILAAVIGAGASILTNLISGFVLPYVTRRFNKKDEDIKKTNAVIEQVFQTLLSIDALCLDLAYDVRNPSNRNIDSIGRIKEISFTSQKITMLIRLYLGNLKKDMEEYRTNLGKYWNAIGALDAGKNGKPQQQAGILYENLAKAESAYQTSLENMLGKLEQSVK